MFFNLLVGIALLVVVVILLQLFAPQMVAGLMNANRSPVGLTAQAANTSEAEPLPAATSDGISAMDVDVPVGDLLVAVTSLYRPADQYLGETQSLTLLDPDEEFILVTMRVKCNSLQACRFNVSEFGIQTPNGVIFPPHDPVNHPNVNGLLQSGVLGAEKTVKGGIFYIVEIGARNLLLYYPMSSDSDRVRFELH
jgi:hypothetical protein